MIHYWWRCLNLLEVQGESFKTPIGLWISRTAEFCGKFQHWGLPPNCKKCGKCIGIFVSFSRSTDIFNLVKVVRCQSNRFDAVAIVKYINRSTVHVQAISSGFKDRRALHGGVNGGQRPVIIVGGLAIASIDLSASINKIFK
jgi:hypothetical protein